jgi:nitrite reductase/ring-hydroxylating ferredoxin subunit
LLGWAPEELAALGLSRFADLYLSEHVLRAEKERVFASSWFLVATAEELAAPGDYLAASVVGAPVLVVRGGDGQLGAFHNVCRHRGLTLVEGRGRLGRFLTYPYHQWSYRLDGALAKVPQEQEEFPGLDKSRRGRVPLARWWTTSVRSWPRTWKRAGACRKHSGRQLLPSVLWLGTTKRPCVRSTRR